MAQQDTGLGWSAKSEYLLSSSGLIGSIGNFTLPGYNLPLPVTAANAQDIVNNGVVIAEGTNYEMYASAAIDNCFVNVNPASALRVGFIAPVRGEPVIYEVTRNKNTGGVGSVVTHRCNDYASAKNNVSFYYARAGWSSWDSNVSSTMPNYGYYSFQTELVQALVFNSVSFYKLNDGYSVACIATWYTPDGDTVTSPILISSNADYATLSLDGQSAAVQGRYTTRYDGISFIMSYITGVDGYAGSALPVIDLRQFAAATPAKVFALIAAESFANILVNETVDPYAPFGNTEEGGGEVNPDPEDDDIEEPTLPGLSFAATGLCRIYRADLAALNQLANYMWTDNTFLQTLVNHAIQLIENPMDAIISLCLVPVAPPAFSVGTAEAVSVMYIPTPAAMWPVINQFARVDCGTLNLEETYGSALDYNPYTKVSCFLPYIGFVDLDTDEVMGKTLNVVYRIDVVTGVCVAMIKVNGEVMYQFSGHCAIQMPLSSADFSTVISSLLQAGKLVAGAALTAAGAPEVGGMLLDAPQVSQPSTTVRKMVGTERNPNTGRQITTGTVTETVEKTGKPLALGELAKRQSANTVGAIMNSKFGIEHSGGFSGNSGYLGVRRPFIIVKRPRLANPEQYGQYNGRPSMIYLNLGTCTGYTEVQSIQLTGIAATNSELSEIATLLKTGVIL